MRIITYCLILLLFATSGASAQTGCGGPCGGFTSTEASICQGSSSTFTTTYSSGVTWSASSNLQLQNATADKVIVTGITAGTGFLCMSYNRNGTVCSVCKLVTINSSTLSYADVAGFSLAANNYVNVYASPAQSDLYYTWYVNGVQYTSETLGATQLSVQAYCDQTYKVYVTIRKSGTCGTSTATSACKKFSVSCSSGVLNTDNSCSGGDTVSLLRTAAPGTQLASSSQSGLKIVPNPAVNGQTQLLITGNIRNEHIYVYDMAGKLVYTTKAQPQVVLNHSILSSGIYIIKYKDFSEKVILQ